MGRTRVSVRITSAPIDTQKLQREVQDTAAGAVVQFCGVVRNHHEGAGVISIEYEAYPQMAERILEGIVREAGRRWPLRSVSAVHRTGLLAVGEAAVCISVAAAHRDEAFAACRYILDRVKLEAPIWKRETLQSGERRWVEENQPGYFGESNHG